MKVCTREAETQNKRSPPSSKSTTADDRCGKVRDSQVTGKGWSVFLRDGFIGQENLSSLGRDRCKSAVFSSPGLGLLRLVALDMRDASGYGMVRYGMVQYVYGTVRYGTVLFGTVRFCSERYCTATGGANLRYSYSYGWL